MSAKVKVGGTYKDTTGAFVKVAGSWKKATKAFVKQGGSWVLTLATNIIKSIYLGHLGDRQALKDTYGETLKLGSSVSISADGTAVAASSEAQVVELYNNNTLDGTFAWQQTFWGSDQDLTGLVTPTSFSEGARTFAVGYPWQAGSSGKRSGQVYVYGRSASGFLQKQAVLENNSARNLAGYGTSVAISKDGSSLVLGCPEYGDGSGSSQSSSGMFEMWGRINSQWLLSTYSIGQSRYGRLGSKVAISGDGGTVAVAELGSKLVYIFRKIGLGHWVNIFTISPPFGANSNDYDLVPRLSEDGSTVVIGYSYPGFGDKGSVSIWEQDGVADTYSFKDYLYEPNPSAGSTWGKSLDISSDGTEIVVGAPAYVQGEDWSVGGKCWYFKNPFGKTPTRVGEIGEALDKYPSFGTDVAISDEGTAIFGCPGTGYFITSLQGRGYVYRFRDA